MLDKIRILTLDAYGTPIHWFNLETFAKHQAKGNILWTMGEEQRVLRGGINKNGEQSLFSVPSIIAVRGKAKFRYGNNVALTKNALVMRDRHLCAYCGKKFCTDDLTLEHIMPEARGGKKTWMNIVAACVRCNQRKGCQTPEEAGMKLLYVPYVPDRNEALIMKNRNILADQMDFLMAGVHKNSRLRMS